MSYYIDYSNEFEKIVLTGDVTDALKNVADAICGCVSEDGIYHYCTANGLIESGAS